MCNVSVRVQILMAPDAVRNRALLWSVCAGGAIFIDSAVAVGGHCANLCALIECPEVAACEVLAGCLAVTHRVGKVDVDWLTEAGSRIEAVSAPLLK